MTLQYMQGRVKYARPQAMLFANNPGTIVQDTDTQSPTYGQSFYIPTGEEFTDFIILTDDNRGEINFKPTRIEKRERMVNGRMRSYHIADKLTINTQWSMVPSRSFAKAPSFTSLGEPGNGIAKASRSGYRKAPVSIVLTKEDDIVINIPAITINQLTGNKIIPSTVSAVYSDDETIIVPEITVLGTSGLLITIPSKTIIQPGVVIGAIRTPGVDVDGPTVQYVIPARQIVQPGEVIGATRVYGADPDGVAVTQFSEQYTSDGGAGGVEILDWYNNHTGSFWVYLSYDNYSNFATNKYNNLNKYSQVIEVFFGDFDYSVVKRGGTTYDFWNVSLSLEEV